MNIAIITGASSGMGREFAAQIDSQLCRTDEIWLLARNREAMEKLAGTMRTQTRVIPIDLADERELRRFREVLSISAPKITFIASCAGVGSYGPFAAQTEDDIQAMLHLNVTAQTMLVRMCLPYMRRGSKIVLFASGAAFVPQPGFAVYAASKACAYSFGRALGKELRARGIYVTTVCPGPVDTPFLAHAYKDRGGLNGLKRLTTLDAPRVVARAIDDCKRRRAVSVCGLPMRTLYLATQSMQNIVQLFLTGAGTLPEKRKERKE